MRKLFAAGLIPALVIGASAAALTLTAVLAGADPKPKPARVPSSGEIKLSESNNAMGLKVLAELRKGDKDKNIFISPLSIATALHMTYNGAGSDTATEMASALEISAMDRDTVNKSNRDLRQTLTGNDKLTLNIANAIFARKDMAFGKEFLDRNREFFNAQVEALDFKDPATITHINSWCAKNTSNKITEIVKKINPLDAMFLVNAVYFKADWKYRFKAENTKDGDFNLGGDKKVKVKLMNQRMDIMGLMGDDFMAGKLPYGDDNTAMYVFVPDSADGLDKFLDRLNADQWNEWRKRFFQYDNARVVLPRFKVEYEAKLNEPFKALGMKQAFVWPGADFAEMLANHDKLLYIAEILHKTFVEVNEEGTEAAAVTSVRMAAGSAPSRRIYSLTADKPFFYAIVNETTGAILFMGVMRDPAAK